MNIGTRSILFGAHQFLLHPCLVFLGWWKLYGFPWDPRLWVAFIVHDLGYWGKPNMDGPEGETHPEFGAKLMCALFEVPFYGRWRKPWYDFTISHSRFYARKAGIEPSRLCYADKMATAIMPWWLYLPLVNLTGEIHEYMDVSLHRKEGGKYSHEMRLLGSQREWFASMQKYMLAYIEAHKDGTADTWTPKA